MIVKKDQVVRVNHTRKGVFRAKAGEDFDTETAEWYPLILDQDEFGGGKWYRGEKVPSRASLCEVTVIKEQ
jgi:hypothetical protein